MSISQDNDQWRILNVGHNQVNIQKESRPKLICVNPGGLGVATPSFWPGGREILLQVILHRKYVGMLESGDFS